MSSLSDLAAHGGGIHAEDRGFRLTTLLGLLSLLHPLMLAKSLGTLAVGSTASLIFLREMGKPSQGEDNSVHAALERCVLYSFPWHKSTDLLFGFGNLAFSLVSPGTSISLCPLSYPSIAERRGRTTPSSRRAPLSTVRPNSGHVRRGSTPPIKSLK